MPLSAFPIRTTQAPHYKPNRLPWSCTHRDQLDKQDVPAVYRFKREHIAVEKGDADQTWPATAMCPLCQRGSLRLIAALPQAAVITRSLRHLKLAAVPPI